MPRVRGVLHRVAHLSGDLRKPTGRLNQAVSSAAFKDRLRRLIAGGDVGEDRSRDLRRIAIGQMLHPSPASPKANRGWAEAAEADLRALGVELPA